MVTVGQSIGGYRVLRLLGEGGMGAVYEAVNDQISRRVAIKVLHDQFARQLAQKPQVELRFLNEARAANLIHHPGFVEVYEFSRLPDGQPYIVMEFLDGEPLAQRLSRTDKGAPLPWMLGLIQQMAAALAVAHERGVIHRDLKPENVMLVPHSEWPGRERVKILDLGIAKLHPSDRGEAQHPQTLAGIAMGTPQYMAPEQCEGAAVVDSQADVYSLGVILYEGLSGQRPFEGDSALDIMNQQLWSEPTPLWVHRADLPAEVAELTMRMLAKRAANRPTMREVCELAGRAAHPSGPPGTPLPGLLVPTNPAGVPSVSARSGPLSTADQIDATRPRLPAVAPPPKPIPSLPFIVGPPIVEPRLFIGRQRELRRLCSLWRQPPLQNAAIIGPKRTGKTSLLLTLKNAVAPDQQLDFLPREGACQFIYVDFQDPRLGTVDGLLRHLLTGLKLRAPSRCDLDQFMDAVAAQIHTPTVVLLDEIGVALLRYHELDAAFWEGMRALATSQTAGRLGFVVASHAPPHELAQKSLGGSPFFNIFGYCATLGPWSEAEARSLVALSPLPICERDIVWMLEQSRRWPILMQSLCRERLLTLQEGDAADADGWREEALRQLAPFAHLLS